MHSSHLSANHSELGKKSDYEAHYDPDKLFAIARRPKRDEIGVPDPLPFTGFDLWNHYEVSWLNEKGKPVVALAVICYGCETPAIIESKSMKLYFNSFNNTAFSSSDTVRTLIQKDIAERAGGPVTVTLTTLNETAIHPALYPGFQRGVCIDTLDIDCCIYAPDPALLATGTENTAETLHSNLLKSNCLVTGQPDWGSVLIDYRGKKIRHDSLLRYIVSFRNHNEFHEQCIERIFMDIFRMCKPSELTVYGRYTRRGGLDINPCRSTRQDLADMDNLRLIRQ